jgi:hypothetical protein
MTTMTDKQNIKNKLKLYKKNLELDLDLNCPNGNVFFQNKLHTITEDAKLKKFNQKDMKLAIGNYKMITENAKISNQELVDKFNIIKSFIEEKQELANLAGKKLLVAIGESHNSQKSILFELMLLTHLKKQGMNSLLVEYNDKKLDNVINNNSKHLKTSAVYFAKDVLGLKLTAVDPLNEIMNLVDSRADSFYKLRADAMNQAISKNYQQNQICKVGAMHLKHIMNSPIIEKEFVIAAIDVSADLNKIPLEILDTYSDDAISGKIALQEMPGSLKIDLSCSMESFSLGQLYDIYENNLDLLLTGDTHTSASEVYHSEFAEDTSICEGFDVKENFIKMFGILLNNQISHQDL